MQQQYIGISINISIKFLLLASISLCFCGVITFNSYQMYKIQEILFVVFYFFMLLNNVKSFGFFNIYNIFTILCFIFNYSRVFLSIIGYCDFSECLFFGYTKFPIKITGLCLLLFTFTIYLIDCGYKYSKVLPIQEKTLSDQDSLSNIVLIIMFASFPFAIYGNLKILSYIRAMGYSYYLSGSSKAMYAGITSTLAEYVFKLCFYTSFMYKFTKRKSIVRFILYFILLIISGIKGSRSSFLFPFVFFMAYMVNTKVIKLNLKVFILFIVTGVVFFFAGSFSRGIEYKGTTVLKIIELIVYGQSDSVALPLHFLNSYKELKDVSRLPFLFGDLLFDYNRYDFSQAVINNFQVDYSKYSTVGLGFSFFVEIWDLGIMGIFVAILIGMFIRNISCLIDKNRYLNSFIIISGMSIMWMPRDCVLRVLFKSNLLFVFAAFIFSLILNFLNKYVLLYHNAKVLHG